MRAAETAARRPFPDRPRPGRDGPNGRAAVPEGSDEVLAAQAGLGDRQAFAEIVRRHTPAMSRYAYRMLGDVHDSEDIVQEALLSAWRGLAAFRGESTVRTWLFRLVATKAFNSRRRTRPAPSDPDVLLDRAAPGPGPSDHAIDSHMLADLQVALGHLPARQRACWLLREVEGLSYREIAEVLATSVPAVRGQLERARTGLAERMAQWQ